MRLNLKSQQSHDDVLAKRDASAIGRNGRIRTTDLRLIRASLYWLSYVSEESSLPDATPAYT